MTDTHIVTLAMLLIGIFYNPSKIFNVESESTSPSMAYVFVGR